MWSAEQNPATPLRRRCWIVIAIVLPAMSYAVADDLTPPLPAVQTSAIRRLPPLTSTVSHFTDRELHTANFVETDAPSLEQRVAELERALQLSQQEEQQAANAKRLLPTATLTMQVDADSYQSHQDDANREAVGVIPDGSAFRRARFGFTGDYSVVEYRVEMDFALSGRPSFLDNWVALNDVPYLGQVKIGHFFEPFSLDRVTPNRFMTFMERGLPDQPFAPARNLGIMAQDYNSELSRTWALGVFRTNSNAFGDDTGPPGERAVTGRTTWLPWYDEPSEGRYMAHIGAAFSYRDADADTASFSSQPEARIGAASPNIPFFVDTGAIPASAFQLYGLEAALVNGPFSVQSEYVFVPVDRLNGPDPHFQGWYVMATYFLTGEYRPYRRESGVFDRVRPFEEFFLVRTDEGVASGLGAWEIAARLSHLDLNDQDIAGGKLTDVTIGLNWYWNPYARLVFNYVHPFLNGPTGNNGADLFGMRAHFDF